jgi:hypothetical protein
MGSSVSLGNLPELLGGSMASWVGGLDDSEDVELGKRKWPRECILGVGGVEHSDAE